VRYIIIDRHANWRFHDYARARGKGACAGAHSFAQPPDSSGRWSGTVQRRRDRDSNAGKAIETPWLANLRAAGVTHLFVTALSAYELEFSWHDEGGSPSRMRARADPNLFRLLYENGQVRVYSLTHP
jgi:hypothetical protein